MASSDSNRNIIIVTSSYSNNIIVASRDSNRNNIIVTSRDSNRNNLIVAYNMPTVPKYFDILDLVLTRSLLFANRVMLSSAPNISKVTLSMALCKIVDNIKLEVLVSKEITYYENCYAFHTVNGYLLFSYLL